MDTQVDVTTTAVELPIPGGRQPAIWNEGPDRLWIQRSQANATPGKGWPLDAGKGYEFPTDLQNPVWAVSDGDSDVRIMAVD